MVKKKFSRDRRLAKMIAQENAVSRRRERSANFWGSVVSFLAMIALMFAVPILAMAAGGMDGPDKFFFRRVAVLSFLLAFPVGWVAKVVVRNALEK